MRRGLVAAGIVLGFLADLAACESAVHQQRLATCRRTVPALVPDGSDIKILRAGSGQAGDSIRVDYQAGNGQHVALCRFNAGAMLVAVINDRKALSEASLHLLKRYYLDTPDAAAADPGAR